MWESQSNLEEKDDRPIHSYISNTRNIATTVHIVLQIRLLCTHVKGSYMLCMVQSDTGL